MTQPTDQKHACSICLDDVSFHVYDMKEMPTALGCGHVYHMSCIKEWSDQKFNCPLCRKDIERLDIAGPVTYESIRRLQRRPSPKEAPYITAVRVVCIAIYLIVIVKFIRSQYKPPLDSRNIKPVLQQKLP